MKRIILTVLGLLACLTLAAQTASTSSVAVTAHRGYWKGNAANSIEALKKAQDFGFWGSEFDVQMTSDGVPVVNHDDSIGGVAIHDNPLSALDTVRLGNGEKVPTLDEYLEQGAKSAKTVLVLEIKTQASVDKTIELTKKCIPEPTYVFLSMFSMSWEK